VERANHKLYGFDWKTIVKYRISLYTYMLAYGWRIACWHLSTHSILMCIYILHRRTVGRIHVGTRTACRHFRSFKLKPSLRSTQRTQQICNAKSQLRTFWSNWLMQATKVIGCLRDRANIEQLVRRSMVI